MNITIYPGKLSGAVQAVPSKSYAHRLLICSAFADRETVIDCFQTSDDIDATIRCLNALGADIQAIDGGYRVIPVSSVPESAALHCGESASTLRFLLPVACALGVNATFIMGDSLSKRPLSPLWELLESRGCTLTRHSETAFTASGKLCAGDLSIDGSISSQFISGLLLAAGLTDGTSRVIIPGTTVSAPYIAMTQQVLSIFSANNGITSKYPFHSPGKVCVEGDWSNSAFFLAANALGSDIAVTGLNKDSLQGDREILKHLSPTDKPIQISAGHIPDLVPILAVIYGSKGGAVFTDVGRLRLKESDRIASISKMLNAFGITTQATEDTLTVLPGTYHGCTVDAMGDHRIAMATAIAATVADGPVTVLGAECVSKSYPVFWQIYKALGGKYEQHLR